MGSNGGGTTTFDNSGGSNAAIDLDQPVLTPEMLPSPQMLEVMLQ